MRKAFIFCKKKLSNEHFTILAIQDARTAVKIPITMLMAWKQVPDLPDVDASLQEMIDWLQAEAKVNDYLVLEGDPAAVETLRQAGLKMHLIPLTPGWEPNSLTEMETGHILPNTF